MISLGEICPYSPAGTSLCADGSATDAPIQLPAVVRTQQKTGKLCNKPGVRYRGKTAEGAEVCFTLTSDLSSWLEVGFRFIRASGCANATSGSAYYEGPEPLRGGRSFRANGFTAVIGGSRASGTLADPEVCGSKRFTWLGRRVSR